MYLNLHKQTLGILASSICACLEEMCAFEENVFYCCIVCLARRRRPKRERDRASVNCICCKKLEIEFVQEHVEKHGFLSQLINILNFLENML